MSLIAPVRKLVDDAAVQIVVYPAQGSLLRMYIGGTERTGGIAPVDGLYIDHIGHRNLIRIHEIIDVILLGLVPCGKLKLQICLAGEHGKMLPCEPSELSHKAVDFDGHVLPPKNAVKNIRKSISLLNR